MTARVRLHAASPAHTESVKPCPGCVCAHGEELLAAVKALRAACESLSGEVVGKSATNWGLVNDALVASGRVVAEAEGGAK